MKLGAGMVGMKSEGNGRYSGNRSMNKRRDIAGALNFNNG